MPVTARVQAVYHGDLRLLDVPTLNLATRAIRVNATGQLGSDKAEAKISVNSTDLHEIRPALAALSPGTRIPVLLEGRASYNGSISGKLDALSTHGRIELENFDTELTHLKISAEPAQVGEGRERRAYPLGFTDRRSFLFAEPGQFAAQYVASGQGGRGLFYQRHPPSGHL